MAIAGQTAVLQGRETRSKPKTTAQGKTQNKSTAIHTNGSLQRAVIRIGRTAVSHITVVNMCSGCVYTIVSRNLSSGARFEGANTSKMGDRQNTIVCIFDHKSPRITAYQTHEWLHEAMHLQEDDVRMIQIEGPQRRVYISL